MKKISVCWTVNRTDDGSLFLHLISDDSRVLYGFLDVRLKEGENWPRFEVGDEVTVIIKESEK